MTVDVPGMDPDGNGAPGWTRTSDPELRRLVLYPPELRAHSSHSTASVPFGRYLDTPAIQILGDLSADNRRDAARLNYGGTTGRSESRKIQGKPTRVRISLTLMSRAHLLRAVAGRIADYREGEVPPINAEHVERWLHQFDPLTRDAILAELDHVLARTYVRRSDFASFFGDVTMDTSVVGDDPRAFWSRGTFFKRPLRGQSQGAMLRIFDAALQQRCGLTIAQCGGAGGPLIYIDDAVYTGIHVINDLEQIIQAAERHTDLVMVFYALHNQGLAYAQNQLTHKFRAAGKTVTFAWTSKLGLENSRSIDSDVLWPKSVPDHDETRQYR